MKETKYYIKDTGHILTDESDEVASSLINSGNPIPLWVTKVSYSSGSTLYKPTYNPDSEIIPEIIGQVPATITITASLKSNSKATESTNEYSDYIVPTYMALLDSLTGRKYHLDFYCEDDGAVPEFARFHLPYQLALNRNDNTSSTTSVIHLNVLLENINIVNSSVSKYEVVLKLTILP